LNVLGAIGPNVPCASVGLGVCSNVGNRVGCSVGDGVGGMVGVGVGLGVGGENGAITGCIVAAQLVLADLLVVMVA
jgi:hypothetical protein